MGRARRNQRDAIRKQRAKKRKKGHESDDDDDSDGDDFDYRHLQSRKKEGSDVALNHQDAKTSKQPTAADSDTHGPKGQSDQDTTASVHSKKSQKKSSPNPDSKMNDEESSKKSPVKAAVKKPMDRIERMRLKKQQQKARRKEKKAAKMKLMQSES